MTRALFLLLITLSLAACTAVPDKAIETVEVQAAGNDRYTTLVTQALAGKTDLRRDGIAPVPNEDLVKTPRSVRGLIKRLLEALHTNRFAAHSVLFQLDKGPDPEGALKPVELPAIEEDESDGLLEGG